jgi:segregation and condensation protein B
MANGQTAKIEDTETQVGSVEVTDNVSVHPRAELGHMMRVVEALLFAAAEPLSDKDLAGCLPEGSDIAAVLAALQGEYEPRGVNLVQVAGKWTFRTADDLSFLLRREAVEQKRLSRAALETLSIIAYHQPVTRAEIEEVRGVSISKGTLDILLEIGWIRMRGRRRTPGRPVTYGTTEDFLVQFGLDNLNDLPGMHELKGAGLLESNLPSDFEMPMPHASEELTEDEDPLEDDPEPALEMDLPDLTEPEDR